MAKKVEQRYRQFRHATRVHINFANNYFLLKRLRARLKRSNPTQRLVAVMLLEHLGDIVACEPIVRYLRKKDPKAYIVWGVKKAYRELIDSNPHIDMTLIIHCLTERMLLINKGLFDEVIDLHFTDRYCSVCSKPLKKAKGSSNINLSNYFNYGSLLSAMAQNAGLPALDEGPKLYISQSSVKSVDALNLPKEYIAINCTSNASEKGWPVDKWVQLLSKVKTELALPVFEIGIRPMIDPSEGVCESLCGKISILESAEMIRRAKLFIGIDSGPAHLASAVGTPGIILMGSYLGFTKYIPFSGSYGDNEGVEIIHSEGSVACISVDETLSTVSKMIDKASVSTTSAL